MTRVGLALPIAVTTVLAGCAVGDDYRRPELDAPATYRGVDVPGTSMAVRHWREVFADPALQALLDEALRANLDLSAAETRVRQAQANVVIARSGMLPNLSLGLQTSPVARRSGETFSSSFMAAGFLSWEIDLWGRIRRGTEAAQGDLAAEQAARDGAQVSLIAQTATTYFQLASLREAFVATEYSASLQRDSLRLMRRRNQSGIVSSAEVRQAEGQLAATEALLPENTRQIHATENALAVLLARPPAPYATGQAELELPPVLPTGLPVELLERRPDLRQAEQQLVAANARVGEAKALLLPSLSITGTFGRLSTELGDLLTSSASTVSSLGPNVSQQLYAGGSLVANRDAAIARLDQALLAYRATLVNALREVADAIEAYGRSAEQATLQQTRVTAEREALRLADKRFAAGVISFIEVLDAQRQLLAADIDLVNARLSRQLALVQVYRALGGGWEAPAASASR